MGAATGSGRRPQSESDDGRHHTAGVRFEVITDDQKLWLRRVLDHIERKPK